MKCIFIIIGIALLVVLAWNIIYDLAPHGYEDENTFHEGDPPNEDK